MIRDVNAVEIEATVPRRPAAAESTLPLIRIDTRTDAVPSVKIHFQYPASCGRWDGSCLSSKNGFSSRFVCVGSDSPASRSECTFGRKIRNIQIVDQAESDHISRRCMVSIAVAGGGRMSRYALGRAASGDVVTRTVVFGSGCPDRVGRALPAPRRADRRGRGIACRRWRNVHTQLGRGL